MTLRAEHKRFIVERLACYDSPTEVAEAAQEAFGLDLKRQHVGNYDAGRPYARQRMAPDLVALFDEVRARFVAEVGSIAIAHATYRLRQLDRIARDERSPVIRMQALEQAAKEVGGIYTNRRNVDHTTKGERLSLGWSAE